MSSETPAAPPAPAPTAPPPPPNTNAVPSDNRGGRGRGRGGAGGGGRTGGRHPGGEPPHGRVPMGGRGLVPTDGRGPHPTSNRGGPQHRPVSVHSGSGVPFGHVPAYLPGSSSLVEELDQRILIVLRDGKHLIGVSFISIFDRMRWSFCCLLLALRQFSLCNFRTTFNYSVIRFLLKFRHYHPLINSATWFFRKQLNGG